MKQTNSLKELIILLRFPFFIYLLPVFLFALSQANPIDWDRSIWAFIILHFIVYPASNGYNSYMDQDEGSIGGIEKPPKASKKLFYITVLLDTLAIGLSWWKLDLTFAVMVTAYITASRLYSFRGVRLKKYPILGFATVVIFQGAVTYMMSYYAATQTWEVLFEEPQCWAVLSSAVLIGAGYPLTQVYQHESDRKDHVKTISMLLGIKGTFLFTIGSFILLNLVLFSYFQKTAQLDAFFFLQVFLLPSLIWFFIWIKKVWRDEGQANFKNLMWMNNISAICMNTYFLFLLFY